MLVYEVGAVRMRGWCGCAFHVSAVASVVSEI